MATVHKHLNEFPCASGTYLAIYGSEKLVDKYQHRKMRHMFYAQRNVSGKS
jgi:predicted DNA repair protein MutK